MQQDAKVRTSRYEQVRELVRWERDVPDGARLHVAWLASDGFRVVQGEPRVELHEAVSVFVPRSQCNPARSHFSIVSVMSAATLSLTFRKYSSAFF